MDGRTPPQDRPKGDEENGTSGTSDKAGTPDDFSQGNENHPADRVANFLRQLSDDDEVTRWKAAESLGRIGDPTAVGALIDTLWDDDVRVRLKAAWALGTIGDMHAVPALRRLYRMEREDAREIIAEALEAINRKAGSG